MRQIQVKLSNDLTKYNPLFKEGSVVSIDLDIHDKWSYACQFVWGSIGKEKLELIWSKGYTIVDEEFLEELYQSLKPGDVKIYKGTQGGFKGVKIPIDGKFYTFERDTGRDLADKLKQHGVPYTEVVTKSDGKVVSETDYN